jgi:hypothetical protein
MILRVDPRLKVDTSAFQGTFSRFHNGMSSWGAQKVYKELQKAATWLTINISSTTSASKETKKQNSNSPSAFLITSKNANDRCLHLGHFGHPLHYHTRHSGRKLQQRTYHDAVAFLIYIFMSPRSFDEKTYDKAKAIGLKLVSEILANDEL